MNLNRIVDWIEAGDVPNDQVSHSLYADLITEPIDALAKIYTQLGLEFSDQSSRRMRQYLANKPKEKFGKHEYSVGEAQEILIKREFFARYQEYFKVPDEA